MSSGFHDTFDYNLSQAFRIVANHLAFVQQLGAHYLGPVSEQNVRDVIFDADLIGAICAVQFCLVSADVPIVDDNVIKVNLRRVFPYSLEVSAQVETVGFSRLCHQIADEDLYCLGLVNGVRNLSYEQVRNNAGE